MSKLIERKSTNINSPTTMEISASDAGKVIGVDENGNLTLTEGGGGSFVIKLTYNENEKFQTNKTLNEIVEAFRANRPIIIYEEGNIDVVNVYTFTGYTRGENDHRIYIGNTDASFVLSANDNNSVLTEV